MPTPTTVDILYYTYNFPNEPSDRTFLLSSTDGGVTSARRCSSARTSRTAEPPSGRTTRSTRSRATARTASPCSRTTSTGPPYQPKEQRPRSPMSTGVRWPCCPAAPPSFRTGTRPAGSAPSTSRVLRHRRPQRHGLVDPGLTPGPARTPILGQRPEGPVPFFSEANAPTTRVPGPQEDRRTYRRCQGVIRHAQGPVQRAADVLGGRVRPTQPGLLAGRQHAGTRPATSRAGRSGRDPRFARRFPPARRNSGRRRRLRRLRQRGGHRPGLAGADPRTPHHQRQLIKAKAS